MAVYESQKKMVAGPINNCAAVNRRIAGIGRWFCYCTIYLHLILTLMNRQKHLETILVLVLALGVFYWFSHEKKPELGKYLLLAALVLGLIGLFIPMLADKIHLGWMKLAHVMGWVMSKVILTVVFFVFLFPMAMIVKAMGKSSIKMKSGGSKSYYKERNFLYDKDSLEHVW